MFMLIIITSSILLRNSGNFIHVGNAEEQVPKSLWKRRGIIGAAATDGTLIAITGGKLMSTKIIEKNIEEAKPFVEDKDYAVKSAEDGTADLKKTVKELAKSLADYEKKLEVYVGLGDEVVALEKKLDIIQKDENIEKGLKFLAYDEGRMESIQKEWMVESEV
ncbi:hypothetical protein Tco_0871974 [Tanacetum coccineum]